MSDPNTVLIRVLLEDANNFRQLWKDMRVADALDQSLDLDTPVETENFDGAAMAEWVVPILKVATPIITGVLGFLIARRGELEITRNGQMIKMKGIKPSQLKEIIALIDQSAEDS